MFTHVPFPSPDLRGATWMRWLKRIGFSEAGPDAMTEQVSGPAEVWITGIGLATSLGEGLDAQLGSAQSGTRQRR